MSGQHLISHLGECHRHLSELRNRPDHLRLHCAMLRMEGPAGADIYAQPFARIVRDRPVLARSAGAYGDGAFAVAFYSEDSGRTLAQLETALRDVEAVAGEAQRLLSGLPRCVQDHLLVPDAGDWWRTVFHLAWHFPGRPFLRANRQRLLTEDGSSYRAIEETFAQLYGTGTAKMRDLLPGLIYSTLRHDIVSCSESAIDVVVEILRSSQASQGEQPATQSAEDQPTFRRLRAEFEAAAGWPAHLGIDARLLKLANSFVTPPATEWAAFQPGRSAEQCLLLSRLNATQEICRVCGPATEHFYELAERAGRALPLRFPDEPILSFIAKCDNPGSPVGWSGPRVVVNRGPAERWVGFVFNILRWRGGSALTVNWLTPQGPLGHALGTLDRNVYAASVLAIDLAGLALTSENMQEEASQATPPKRAAVPAPATATETIPQAEIWKKEGEMWTLNFAGKTIRLKDRLGLQYIAHLLSKPRCDLPATILIALASGTSAVHPISGSEILDGQALEDIRRRYDDLVTQQAEARKNNDLGVCERVQQEIGVLAAQLSGATGLRGRKRKVGDDAEKARLSVSNAISRTIKAIRKDHPPLAIHLENSIRSGKSFCYSPERDVGWSF